MMYVQTIFVRQRVSLLLQGCVCRISRFANYCISWALMQLGRWYECSSRADPVCSLIQAGLFSNLVCQNSLRPFPCYPFLVLFILSAIIMRFRKLSSSPLMFVSQTLAAVYTDPALAYSFSNATTLGSAFQVFDISRSSHPPISSFAPPIKTLISASSSSTTTSSTTESQVLGFYVHQGVDSAEILDNTSTTPRQSLQVSSNEQSLITATGMTTSNHVTATTAISIDQSSVAGSIVVSASSRVNSTSSAASTESVVNDITVQSNTTELRPDSLVESSASCTPTAIISRFSLTSNTSTIGKLIATGSQDRSGIKASVSAGIRTISKIVVTATTLLVPSGFSNHSTASSATFATSVGPGLSLLGNNATPVRSSAPGTTAPAELRYPLSWYAACSQLSFATYVAPKISGSINGSEYISSCNAAFSTYNSFMSFYNKTLLEMTWTADTEVSYVTSWPSMRVNPNTPPGLFTMCDSFTRLNTSTYAHYLTEYFDKATTQIGAPYGAAYPSSTCVFNGTTPQYPAPPDCSIPSASCTNLWSTWAQTGTVGELASIVVWNSPSYTGTINTPACDPGDPFFTCDAAGKFATSVTCNTGLSTCFMQANKVNVFYWPPSTRGGGLCTGNATTITPTGLQYATITVDPGHVVTITSPTAFISIDKVWAFYFRSSIGTSLRTFPTYYNIATPILQASLSTVEFGIAEFNGSQQEELECISSGIACQQNRGQGPRVKSFDFANLDGPVPAPVYFFGAATQGWFEREKKLALSAHATLPADWTIYDDYSACLAVPSQIRDIDPAFETCAVWLAGPIDPPTRLTAAFTLTDTATLPIQKSSTTAASPSLTAAPVPTTSVALLQDKSMSSLELADPSTGASSTSPKSSELESSSAIPGSIPSQGIDDLLLVAEAAGSLSSVLNTVNFSGMSASSFASQPGQTSELIPGDPTKPFDPGSSTLVH